MEKQKNSQQQVEGQQPLPMSVEELNELTTVMEDLDNEFIVAMHGRLDQSWVMPAGELSKTLACLIDTANTARSTYVKLRLVELGLSSGE